MTAIINSIPALEPLALPLLQQKKITASVLRLDAVHPVVSGNKWYKLKIYLAGAVRQNKKTLLTFGGAFSNHIVATAAACAQVGLQAVGIIRGEEAKQLSHTLLEARSYGMQLHFVSRTAYRNKEIPGAVYQKFLPEDCIVVPEGGYGQEGMEGAATILSEIDAGSFTHLLCAVGTGTTLAGLAHGAAPHQQVVGISVLKNNFSLESAARQLLPPHQQNDFKILHPFHFGGYAKNTPSLLQHMNEWFRLTGIPSDFVYTGKLFAAFTQLCTEDFFPAGSKVLLVHSGGLQGNRSLPPGTLIF